MQNLILGIVMILVFVFIIAMSFITGETRGMTVIQDEAVKLGYGEYVIIDKQIVFKWKGR